MLETLQNAGPLLLLNIRALLPTLNDQEQKVGQYILEHPDEVIHLSVNELSLRAGASDATIIRFCRKVGVKGYQALKIRLAQEATSVSAKPYTPIAREDSLGSAVHKVIAADVKALEDTLLMLNIEVLEQAANVLLTARCVDIYSTGEGTAAGYELQYKLLRVGIRGVLHADGEMQTVSATRLTPADAAVGISHSGESTDILHALQLAKEAGATTVALTNHPASAIARSSDITLTTAAQEALTQAPPLGARVAQIGLIDALFAVLMLKRGDEAGRSPAKIAQDLRRRHSAG